MARSFDGTDRNIVLQHAETGPYLDELGIAWDVDWPQSGKRRSDALARLADGTTRLIGTHALFQSEIEFQDQYGGG